jgi:acetyl esterase/lipase
VTGSHTSGDCNPGRVNSVRPGLQFPPNGDHLRRNCSPFLILHVAGHPDVTAQALRFSSALKAADVPVTVFGASETTHNKLDADLGLPNDPATKELFKFLGPQVAAERTPR